MPKVSIVEVGPRDGLQNESVILDISTRLQFAQKLVRAGLKRIEMGAFVSPHWVPQMAESKRLLQRLRKLQKNGHIPSHIRFSALVPNAKGMSQAIEAGIREVAIFASASEIFSKKNLNCTIHESFARFQSVIQLARKHRIRVRGYLSCCFGCPFEGNIPIDNVVRYASKLLELGTYEVSISDTIGVAGPLQVRQVVQKLTEQIDYQQLAMHFHDTRGLAIANIYESLSCGIRTFDTSLGGLGGCPYAPGASGNVATEDVAYALARMGYATNIDLKALIRINRWIAQQIQHPLPSRIGCVGV